MANEEYIQILKQGSKIWNEWRATNNEVRPDLKGADLRSEQLRMANLSKAILTEARLNQAQLTDANLQDSDLTGGELRWAEMTNANLSGAILRKADLREVNLRNAKLLQTNLSGADLSGSVLEGADLSQAILIEANLSGADLTSAHLNEADLTNANLQHTNFSNTKLTKARLDGADLTHARFSGAVLQHTSLKGANLKGAGLFGTDLRQADLTDADFSEADLSRAIINEERLKPGQLSERQWNQLGSSKQAEPRKKLKSNKENQPDGHSEDVENAQAEEPTGGSPSREQQEPFANPETTDDGQSYHNAIQASIAGFSVSDQPSEVDTLGFESYTTAIARFLTHEDTKPPLTLSIEGEWGSGKSSFMLQLRKKLEGPDAYTVEFSPWRHDKEEAVWAAFVVAFINQLSERLGWIKATMANLKLSWDRFNWQKGWPDVAKIAVKLWVYFLMIFATLIVGFWAAKIPYIQNIDFPAKLLLSISVIGASTGAFVLKGLKKAKELVGNPFEHDLKKYIETPDYAARIPFIEQFHKDFKKIVERYASNKTVYVFIDDLDRCEVPKAAELMKAINLMITEEPNLVFIIGMDRQKVAAGLAVKDKDLIRYLRPDIPEQKRDDVVASFWSSGLWYGYDFIEKFIQLPFTLPRPTETDIDKMLASIVVKNRATTSNKDTESSNLTKMNGDSTEIRRSKREESETSQELKKMQEIEQKQKRQMELRLADDSEQVRQIVHMAVPFVGFNPRRIKQFINMFRLRAYIAYETQLLILPEDVGQTEGVTLEQLGKFVTISLRWPLFLEALVQDESLLRILSDFAELREKDVTTLKNEVARYWAMKNQLMQLIRFGCVRGEAKPHEWTKYTISRAKIDKLLQVSMKVKSIKLAPLEINVSSSVAVTEAAGPQVVISEQRTNNRIEKEDIKQPETNQEKPTP